MKIILIILTIMEFSWKHPEPTLTAARAIAKAARMAAVRCQTSGVTKR